MGVEDGGKLGNHWWYYWPFSKHHGCLWPFVEEGANGSVAICRGGYSWPFIDGGDGPLLPFVNHGCGWSWPFIDPGGGHLSMVLMGSCGHSSTPVMGTGHYWASSFSVNPGGGSSWPIIDSCGGCSLCFVVVVRREG